jgi:hypothetical protein
MIQKATNPSCNSYGSLAQSKDAVIRDKSAPFRSSEKVFALIDSLRSGVKDITCFMDPSVLLGYAPEYLRATAPSQRNPVLMRGFSQFYEALNSIFAQENVMITRIAQWNLKTIMSRDCSFRLMGEISPEGIELSRQVQALLIKVCAKRAYIPSSNYVSLTNDLDNEELSAVLEKALQRRDLIGLATKDGAQMITLREKGEEFSKKGTPLPLELIGYNFSTMQYDRKSLYDTSALSAAT